MVERDVRAALRIPFNSGAAALRYEHSMGQGLPGFIHRMSEAERAFHPADEPTRERAAAR
jgi:hypothetical protein